MNPRPLFRSLEEAIEFAYWRWYGYADTVGGSPLGRLREAAPAVYRETEPLPRGYDAAAQAGMIRAYIDSLPDPDRAHIEARFVGSSYRDEAKSRLVRWVLPTLPPGMHSRRLIFDLVSMYYGSAKRMKALRERHGVGKFRLWTLRRGVYTTLDAIACRAESRVYDDLRQRGVL